MADFAVTAQHHAVGGRDDQVVIALRLGAPRRGLGGVEFGTGAVEFGRGDEMLGDQILGALEIAARELFAGGHFLHRAVEVGRF